MSELVETTAYFLDNPVALIIGCGDLGIASARALGKRSPVLMADINEQRLGECVETLRHEGFTASGQVCDISDAEQVNRLGNLLKQTKGVRVLAHVAALNRTSLSWRKVMDVNLLGVHRIAKAAEPHMVPGGVAILISSIGAWMTPPNPEIETLLNDPLHPDFFDRLEAAFGRVPVYDDAYFMSKKGMIQLAKRLAVEWGPRQVRSLTISPGVVDTTMARIGGTEMFVPDDDGGKREVTWEEFAVQSVPLRRRGRIPELTDVIEFMASDAASFITGIDIPIDGGSLAAGEWRRFRE